MGSIPTRSRQKSPVQTLCTGLFFLCKREKMERNRKTIYKHLFPVDLLFLCAFAGNCKKRGIRRSTGQKKLKRGAKSLRFENVTELTRPLSGTMEKDLQKKRK
ncbi:MAG: hypothetical protein IIX99_02290 [Oscillospiraceae bacterium]|nr:hypothetical protein [Oscillospiraceae bacterium]